MNPLLSIFTSLFAIAFAGAYPFLIRQPRVREILRAALPERFQPRDTGGFAAISPRAQLRVPPEDQLRRIVIEALGLIMVVGGALYLLGDSNGASGHLPLPLAGLMGIAGGLLLRKLWYIHEQLTEIRRCADRMLLGGIEGSWLGAADDPIPFRQELLRAAQESTSIDILSPSGLSALALLSHPARAAFEAPHPGLAGKRLRILVLPPRSSKIDPQKQRRSCAEEALSRSGTTPEKHWRRLQRALDVQRRWNTEYGCNVQVRFLEGRPIHAAILAGPRGWFRPWYGAANHWYEVSARGGGTDLRTSLDDHFENTWYEASEELSVFLRKDGSAAVMSTGSTAVRKTTTA